MITTSHLTPGTVSAIITPFQESATVVRALQVLADRICSAPPQAHGKVIQMFSSAIYSELIEFKEFVASVERTYHQRCTGTREANTPVCCSVSFLMTPFLY
jgi:hypothetical protein